LGGLATLLAQTTSGTFGGTVSDPAGGRVPRAAVTALNVETGQKFKAVTTGTGDFVIAEVPPGNYEVDIVAKGFKTLSRKGLTLEVAGKITLDLMLEVGSISESVSITAEAPMLRTQDAQTGEIITTQMIENIPQLNRDNILNLLLLSGDVTGSVVQPGVGGQTLSSDIRINGGRMAMTDVLVDGQSISTGKGHTVFEGETPSMEQTDEFKVITNGIPAEYGRVSGGIITMATKGGTNGLHGQGFEYFENQLFDANSWQQNWSSPYVAGQKAARAQFHQNDFGGAIGGPVIIPKVYNGKNRTFFFFNYEGLRYRTGGTNQLVADATQAEKNGDLSGLIAGGYPAMMYDPLGDVGYATGLVGEPATCENGQPCQVKLTIFPNNGTLIPAARISAMAANLNPLLPLPNQPGTAAYSMQNAWLGQSTSQSNNDRWEIRADHNITQNSRLTFRIYMDHGDSENGAYFSVVNPGSDTIVPGARQGSIAWTWTASPTTIVELRAGVMHNPNRNGSLFPNGESGWKVDPVLQTLSESHPGSINELVWSAPAAWGGGSSELGNQQLNSNETDDVQTSVNSAAAVTKIWNQHTFKLGAENRRMYTNHAYFFETNLNYQGDATAISNDNGWGAGAGGTNYGHNGNANSYGDYLLGIFYTNDNGVSAASPAEFADYQGYYAGYIQDDFKVSKKLTLNLGLRWDMETPLTERTGVLLGYNPNAPSPYTLPAGYSWTGSLQAAGLTAAQIAQVPTPSWVTNGLPSGAVCYVNTALCPTSGNSIFRMHPWQFAPRLAAAYALNNKTVLRASWGMMYLTATGDYYQSYIVNANQGIDPYPPPRTNGATGAELYVNSLGSGVPGGAAFPGTSYVPFVQNNAAANATFGAGGDAWNINARPPMEQNWNVTIQRQLPAGILLEVGYNGNHSGDLLTGQPQYPYPVNLINPQNTALFSSVVQNPMYKQVTAGYFTGATEPLGALENANPAFAGNNAGSTNGMEIYGQNIGKSMYNAGTLRVTKRLSHGLTFLFTYTYSKSLDNVGDAASISGGAGAKYLQSWQTINDVYGYSPMDMTHRITFYHDYQLPFGRGRQFFGAPKSVGAKIVDGVIGGWGYAGIWTWHSGTPLLFSTSTGNVSVVEGVPALGGFISTNDISASNFTNNSALLTSTQINVGTGGTDLGSALIRRFNANDFFPAVAMTPGNMPDVFPWIRNPGVFSYDASLMKNFAVARDGKIYLQVRVEAQNLFNAQGLGPYNTEFGINSDAFGLISSRALGPRIMQMSMRLFF